jgi:hypothetical protein
VYFRPCGDDNVFEIVNNTDNNNLTLSIEYTGRIYEMYWYLRTKSRPRLRFGRCFFHGSSEDLFFQDCSYRGLNFITFSSDSTPTINKTTVSMIISTTSQHFNLTSEFFDNCTALFGGSTIRVDAFGGPFFQSQCLTDFIGE